MQAYILSDTIKSTRNRIIILYFKYVVCDRFIFDFAQYFLRNIFNSKSIKVYSCISVNKIMNPNVFLYFFVIETYPSFILVKLFLEKCN